MMSALHYKMGNGLVHLCHAGLQPGAEGDLGAALLYIG